ncbi:RNA-directed DNA polymerase from mobile element jockey [Trichonephila clavipes]|nr:RNA-directed DNA polymerase from mobile element jockey [Trichonephila clavipes]
MGTVEVTSVTLTPPGGDPLVITSLYISPCVSHQHTHTDVEAIFSLGNASIICGDFNAHHTSWGCQRNDTRGKIIRNLIDSTNTQIIAPTTPTRFGYGSTSTIDFPLTRNIHWPSQVESIAELSSDHNPLIISFRSETSLQTGRPFENSQVPPTTLFIQSLRARGKTSTHKLPTSPTRS